MEIIDRIKENFNRGYFDKAMIINELPEEYPAWTIKRNDWIGVAVPLDTYATFSERFSEVKIYTAPNTEINGKVYDLLMLTCTDLELRNEFAVICSQFVLPGSNGVSRNELIEDPKKWWTNWKFLLGNVNTSRSAYPVLGELTVLEKLILANKPAKWTGANAATHDIEVPDYSYEVKSTTQRTGYEVTISSLYQMNKSGKTLDLVFCRFEPSVLGRSVDDIIDSLVKNGYPEAELESSLKKLDLEKGCTARATKFKLLEMKIFPVDDSFPAVTEKSFIGEKIPVCVKNFSYTLDLTGIHSKNTL